MLYDSQGKLLFSGGITSGRGQGGDNAGRAAIVSLLTENEAKQKATPVFGCPLFSENKDCRMGKEFGSANYK